MVSAVAALIWVNIDAHSYERVWGTTLSVRVGGVGPVHDLRCWINSGLMALFFYVAFAGKWQLSLFRFQREWVNGP
jgi:Na+/H+ antiporter NhaA